MQGEEGGGGLRKIKLMKKAPLHDILIFFAVFETGMVRHGGSQTSRECNILHLTHYGTLSALSILSFCHTFIFNKNLHYDYSSFHAETPSNKVVNRK